MIESLDKHLEKHCDYSIVHCKFCSEKMQRKLMGPHEEEHLHKIFQDISEMKAAQASWEKMYREKVQELAKVSQELRELNESQDSLRQEHARLSHNRHQWLVHVAVAVVAVLCALLAFYVSFYMTRVRN